MLDYQKGGKDGRKSTRTERWNKKPGCKDKLEEHKTERKGGRMERRT